MYFRVNLNLQGKISILHQELPPSPSTWMVSCLYERKQEAKPVAFPLQLTLAGERVCAHSWLGNTHTHTHTHTQKRKRFTSLTIAATTQKTEPIKLLPEITLFSYSFPHLFRNLLFNRKEGNLVKCSELNESFLLDILSLNLIPS